MRAETTGGGRHYLCEMQDGWGETLELSKPFEILDRDLTVVKRVWTPPCKVPVN